MRIADTHSLPIMFDKETTLFLGREVFARCTEELEWYTTAHKPLKLQLSSFDVFGIEKQYPQPNAHLEIKLVAVIEDILEVIQMPYILFPILRPDRDTLVFYGRVRRRDKKPPVA